VKGLCYDLESGVLLCEVPGAGCEVWCLEGRARTYGRAIRLRKHAHLATDEPKLIRPPPVDAQPAEIDCNPCEVSDGQGEREREREREKGKILREQQQQLMLPRLSASSSVSGKKQGGIGGARRRRNAGNYVMGMMPWSVVHRQLGHECCPITRGEGMHVKSDPQSDETAAEEEGPMDAEGCTWVRDVWALEQDAVRSPYSSLLMLLALHAPHSSPPPQPWTPSSVSNPLLYTPPAQKPVLALSALNPASVNQCKGLCLLLPLLNLQPQLPVLPAAPPFSPAISKGENRRRFWRVKFRE
jgi:hypothetical protein